jgi:hypothetical protein
MTKEQREQSGRTGRARHRGTQGNTEDPIFITRDEGIQICESVEGGESESLS